VHHDPYFICFSRQRLCQKTLFVAAIIFDNVFLFVFFKCSSNYFYLKYIKLMFFKVFYFIFLM
jgi:hypothetical protein